MQNPEDERVDLPPVRQPDDLKDLDFGSEEKPKAAGGWKALLTPALISIIVTFGMFQFFFAPNMVTKDDATTNFENITNTIGQIQEKQNQINSALTSKADSSQVANLSQQIANIQNKLNDLPSNASIQSISSEITNNVTSVINDKFSEFSSTIETMQSDIEELQTVKEEEEESKDESEVEFDVSSDYLYLTTQDVITGSTFFEITNDSKSEIEISGIDIVIYPASLGGKTYFTSCKASSSLLMTWNVIALGSDMFMVQGRPNSYIGDVVVEEDSDPSYPLLFTFTLKEGVTLPESGLQMGVKVNAVSWEFRD